MLSETVRFQAVEQPCLVINGVHSNALAYDPDLDLCELRAFVPGCGGRRRIPIVVETPVVDLPEHLSAQHRKRRLVAPSGPQH